MNKFLTDHLEKLKVIFDNPIMELRALLNKCSVSEKDIIFSNFILEDINILKFNEAFKRRIKREPLSKIFNSKNFWKYDFYVDNNVLDPRPETELIIEKILEYYPDKNKALKIIDICTGSGSLAISIGKEYKNSEITATDISPFAIKIAKLNYNKLNCTNKINFIECDLIKNYEYFDIVVSNPPYLSELEYTHIEPEILLYEPKIALLASDKGFEFYTKISHILPNILHNYSKVFIEIGSSQRVKAINIFKSNQINCLEVVNDINNLNRVLILNKS